MLRAQTMNESGIQSKVILPMLKEPMISLLDNQVFKLSGIK